LVKWLGIDTQLLGRNKTIDPVLFLEELYKSDFESCAEFEPELFANKTGNENFPNVNLVLSICQLIVYLTIPVSNLSLVRRFHYEKNVKMCQFYSDSSRFFCNQLYSVINIIQQ
jgi:hypothetical protein